MNLVEKKNLLPFILVTSLFMLWGLANNMTDTLLSAFKKIMSMSDTQTSLIQFAFYGSYFCFALPAAKAASYAFYLIAIYIMAGGYLALVVKDAAAFCKENSEGILLHIRRQ